MSPEERQLLQGLFDRMRNNSSGPRDREAEQMISDSVRQQPYAPYLLAQTVIVQDQALQAANDRLQQLEQQLHDTQSQPQGGGGFLSGLFGGGAAHQPAPPPPQRPTWNQGGTGYPPQGGGYPPQQSYAPPPPQGGGFQGGGPWGGGAPQQPQGGGFLRGALGAAAGVAGGVLAADAIGSLFRGGHAGGGLGITDGVPGFGGSGATTVNNYYGDSNQLTDADRTQDALQDQNDNYNNGPTAADWQQDADQDQDDAQDAGDYDNDV